MTTRILCLSIVFLIATVHPFSLIQSLTMFPGMKDISDKKRFFERGFMIALGIISLSAIVLIPKMRVMCAIDGRAYLWMFAGVLSGGLVIILEIAIEAIRLRVHGVSIGTVEVKSDYRNRNFIDIGVIVIIAACEELVYRKLWFIILGDFLGINIFLIVGISSVIYAMNHLYMGGRVLFQKILSGIIFSALFILSGSIIIPIIAHVTQNIIVLLVGKR